MLGEAVRTQFNFSPSRWKGRIFSDLVVILRGLKQFVASGAVPLGGHQNPFGALQFPLTSQVRLRRGRDGLGQIQNPAFLPTTTRASVAYMLPVVATQPIQKANSSYRTCLLRSRTLWPFRVGFRADYKIRGAFQYHISLQLLGVQPRVFSTTSMNAFTSGTCG